MNRRRWSVIAAAAIIAATLGALGTLASLPAGAQTAPFRTLAILGRRTVFPVQGTAAWEAVQHLEYGDTNNNAGWDSERGRVAVWETYGISRVRIYSAQVQQRFDGPDADTLADHWEVVLVNPTDVVGTQTRAHAISYTPPGRFCANPNQYRVTRVVNIHAIRRASDSAVFNRTSYSKTIWARMLASDRDCRPPTPTPTTSSTTTSSTTTSTTAAPTPADLQVTVADSPDPVQHNQVLTLTVTARNTGGTDAAGSQLVIDIPESLLVTAADITAPAGTTCALADIDPSAAINGGVVCTLGTLSAGETAVITVRGGATAVGSLSTVAVLSSAATGVADDTDTEATTVVASANLALDKSATPTPVADGNTYAFTFTVSNAGPDVATGVVVTDPWPDHLNDPVIPLGSPCTFNDAADTLSCNFGSVGIGAAAAETATITALVTADGTNTAAVDGDQADPALANNSDSATINL